MNWYEQTKTDGSRLNESPSEKEGKLDSLPKVNTVNRLVPQ